jgi:hypothetical protein
MVVPCLKETVSPFGGGPIRELTLAVNVTACPKVEGFGEEVRVVVVTALTSSLVINASVLPA